MPVSTLQPSDISFVGTLAQEAGFQLDMQAEFTRDYARLWVARREPGSIEPDAFLLAWIAADELHLIAIATRPDARRLGIGRELVATLIEFGRSRQSRLVILEVRRSNAAALALYRGFGFAVSRLRRQYYGDPVEDGIELQLVLDDHGNVVPSPDEVPWLEVSECLR
jgi:ribosomal-protein-alanine N-acetyltransferase